MSRCPGHVRRGRLRPGPEHADTGRRRHPRLRGRPDSGPRPYEGPGAEPYEVPGRSRTRVPARSRTRTRAPGRTRTGAPSRSPTPAPVPGSGRDSGRGPRSVRAPSRTPPSRFRGRPPRWTRTPTSTARASARSPPNPAPAPRWRPRRGPPSSSQATTC
ncbi:hypothetical protein NKH77_36020 [Streptomyces sp. M19]